MCGPSVYSPHYLICVLVYKSGNVTRLTDLKIISQDGSRDSKLFHKGALGRHGDLNQMGVPVTLYLCVDFNDDRHIMNAWNNKTYCYGLWRSQRDGGGRGGLV